MAVCFDFKFRTYLFPLIKWLAKFLSHYAGTLVSDFVQWQHFVLPVDHGQLDLYLDKFPKIFIWVEIKKRVLIYL